MKVRTHPLTILVGIVVFGLILGLFGSRFFYHRYEQELLRTYKETGIGASSEIEDSALGFLLVGVGLGLLVGLVVGISVYVAIKQRPNSPKRLSDIRPATGNRKGYL